MDPADQQRLLTLADLDKRLSQLQHQRTSLPQLAAISAAAQQASAASDRLQDTQTRRNDLGREMKRLEGDIDNVRARFERNQQRVDSGAISNPKDITALQHENDTLRRRQGDLEDQELELMERAEELDTELTGIQSEIDAIEAGQRTAETERDESWQRIDGETAGTQQQRDTVAATFPDEIVALYDKIRAGGAVGAALLGQRRCGGCRMELSGSELAAVRAAAPNDIVRCDSCRCILVRTAESGL